MDTASKHKAKTVVEVKLKIGELTLLNHEQLTFSLKTLCRGTEAENLKITIKPIIAKLKCGKCGWEWLPGKIIRSPSLKHLSSLSCVQCDNAINLIMQCPKCSYNEPHFSSGKECIIDEIALGTNQIEKAKAL